MSEVNSSKLNKIALEDKEYLFQNYGDRMPVCFKSGEGSRLKDQDGKEYIDFFAGIAVSNLGYNNRAINAALTAQINRVVHTSNWYYNKEQIEAAKLLSELAFKGKTLFCNSGTEANEAAIKLARKHGLTRSAETIKIITFENSFHGRTFGAMSATAQKKIHEGFGPIVPGFIYLPYNDAAAFTKADKSDVCAVIIELVQGEGGIIIADKTFVKAAADFCAKNNALLIIDEVQTGIGRTGKPFAYQHYGIDPDVITLAKGLAGGLPAGAMHAKGPLAELLPKGTHGSTFGGNHLACAAAAAVLKQLKNPKLLEAVQKSGSYIMDELKKFQKETSIIKEVRGLGLHIGAELTVPGTEMVKQALSMGLIINCTSEKVIRVMPPLNIPMKEIKKGMAILRKVILQK